MITTLEHGTVEDVTIAGEAVCRGWLYRPPTEGPTPIVVLAHGYSATHAFHYWRTAEGLLAAGFAVLDFDSRGLGASAGHPRQRIVISEQLADLAAAISFARDLPGIGDVVLYGSSAGGGLAIEVAASDPRLAAVVLIVPHVDGLSNLPGAAMSARFQLLRACLADRLGRTFGAQPRTLQVFGAPNSDPAIIDRDGCSAALREEMIPGGVWHEQDLRYEAGDGGYTNAVTAWEVLDLLRFRPGRKLAQVTAPVLMVIGTNDTVTPPGPQRRLARAVGADLVELPINHFDPFRKATHFDDVLAAQVGFLRRTLGTHANDKRQLRG